MRAVLLPLLLVACEGVQPIHYDLATCEPGDAPAVEHSRVLLHGVGTELPEMEIRDRAAFDAFLTAYGLPDLDVDFDREWVLSVTAWSELDCEYPDDTTGELELTYTDTGFQLVVPVARSTEDCRPEVRPMPVLVAIGCDEVGELEAICVVRDEG